MLHGIRRLIPFLCSAPGWVDSSWTSRPNTWTSRPSRDGPSWQPNTGEPNSSSYNNNHDAAYNDWVDQSWQSNAPSLQASTRTNQCDSYYYNDDHEPWPLESNNEEEYPYKPSAYDATQDWSTPLPRYNPVPVPEPQWQPYNMPQYNHEIETLEQLRHLGTFGLKPAYQFGTHKDDPRKSEYTKLKPSKLTIASSTMAGQRARHVLLNECHAAVVTKMNATISELGKTINIDSWGRTASFPYELARSTPDTSFDERRNVGGKPGYQWYTKIEVACHNLRAALVEWQRCDEGLDWGFRQNLSKYGLPSQIARLNRKHREISGIDYLINVADEMELIFRYPRLWTQDEMKREAPVAVSILGVICDIQKVCQANDRLFEDRAPFLAYKVDLLLRQHQLRGLRGTS